MMALEMRHSKYIIILGAICQVNAHKKQLNNTTKQLYNILLLNLPLVRIKGHETI